MRALHLVLLKSAIPLLAVVVLGLAPAPAAHAAAKAPTATPARPMAKESFTLSGRLPSTVRRPVVLQHRTATGWRTLRKARTTTAGRYAFRTSTSAKRRFRVVAPRARISGAWRTRITTGTRTIPPVAQTGSATLTASTNLRATFRPVRKDRLVSLQVDKGSGWVSAGVANRHQSNTGQVHFAITLPDTGSWRYRALTAPYRGAASRATGAVTATAPVPPPSTDAVTLVSRAGAVAGNGVSTMPTVSTDGRYVAYRSSATDLVPGDTNGQADVFLTDLSTGVTTLVSEGQGDVPADNSSADPMVSGSGNCVVFESRASNLVLDDTNGATDLFLWRRASDTITRITTRPDGSQSIGGSIGWSDVTPDCEFVAYDTAISDLDAEDNNIRSDVFRWTQPDTSIPGTNRRISKAREAGGHEQVADGNSEAASINDDGNLIAFHSTAGNLVAGDEYDALRGRDVFVWDQATNTLDRITAGNDDHSGNPAFNGTGTRVAYASAATNALGLGGQTLPGGHSQVIVQDLQTGAFMLGSRTVTGGAGDRSSTLPSLSTSGTELVFGSRSTDLAEPVEAVLDTDHDAFVRDLLLGVSTRVSAGPGGADSGADSYNPVISGDGDHVVFSSSSSSLAPGDTNGLDDIFIWTRP